VLFVLAKVQETEVGNFGINSIREFDLKMQGGLC